MRILKIFLLLLLLGVVSLGAATFWVQRQPVPMIAERIEFHVPVGASLRAVSQIVEKAGIGLPAWELTLLGRVLGRSGQIKAGSYEIVRGVTAMHVLDILTRGDVSRGDLVLVEGRSFRQLRDLLNAHSNLVHDTKELTDKDILERLGLTDEHPEGLFFPDTYLFDKGSSDLDVLRRAHRAMQKRLSDAWQARDPDLPLKSAYEMLTLASIVEKETGLAADRGPIASVFINRLRRGMPLQTDPTVIYGLGDKFNGNLRKGDLQTDTPWNTYTRAGLPPTPIAMPGSAALQAVSRPPATGFLYFVSRGDGSSEFSSSLEAHNRAVSRYQKGGKS